MCAFIQRWALSHTPLLIVKNFLVFTYFLFVQIALWTRKLRIFPNNRLNQLITKSINYNNQLIKKHAQLPKKINALQSRYSKYSLISILDMRSHLFKATQLLNQMCPICNKVWDHTAKGLLKNCQKFHGKKQIIFEGVLKDTASAKNTLVLQSGRCNFHPPPLGLK